MQAYADSKELGVHDMWKLQAERSALQHQYLEQWASYAGLDAILGEYNQYHCLSLFSDFYGAPTTPYSSVPHGDFKYVGYTGVYNVVDYSAVSFPTGFSVDKSLDTPAADYKAQSTYCQDAHDSCKHPKTNAGRRIVTDHC
jgi:amidase